MDQQTAAIPCSASGVPPTSDRVRDHGQGACMRVGPAAHVRRPTHPRLGALGDPAQRPWCGCIATRPHRPTIALYRPAIASALPGNPVASRRTFRVRTISRGGLRSADIGFNWRKGFNWHKPIFGAARDITTARCRAGTMVHLGEACARGWNMLEWRACRGNLFDWDRRRRAETDRKSARTPTVFRNSRVLRTPCGILCHG